MSLEQAYTFYEILGSNKAIYEKYLINCCNRGLFGSYHWDKSKIVNFASSLGYKFTESELAQVWFESKPGVTRQLSVIS